ncbi:flagellar hook-length control protein FliK [Oceanimonas sp. CHS3-5]|uniref:flagellar hook-length control protein FliK n=1 Tax=Oceanimonas sp. CHS3-5 TaxID=3068186 RepID=UPI00273D01FF|nr:flagellar hook-length control protein FliK [Oceanimonas sp. CHS3-5]MDP5290716.1 flagellar hook-length control protein FliK [Oceanimonas sp. CHS3-5]
MTTVIPALSGGMGSARSVSPPGEAGKPSAFSELLAQAGSEAEVGNRLPADAAPAADTGKAPVLADETVSAADEAAAETDAAAAEAGANKSSTTDAPGVSAEAEQGANSAKETGEEPPEEAGLPAVPLMAPGGKVLPEAANISTEQADNDMTEPRRNMRSAGEPSGTPPSTEPASTKPSSAAFEGGRAVPVSSANDAEADAGRQPAETKAAASAQNHAAESALGNTVNTPPSSAAEEDTPAEAKPAPLKPESAQAGRSDGIPLSGMQAVQARRTQATPPVQEKAPVIQPGNSPEAMPAGSRPAAGEAIPAHEPPAKEAGVRQPGMGPDAAERQAPRSAPVNFVAAEPPAAESDVTPEQAAQPRQDAAVTRQDGQRQPATPEWLAQIEHGRRWQQQSGTTTATEQPAELTVEAGDTERPVADNAGEAKDQSADSGARGERLAEAMMAGQGTGREVPVQQAGVSDGQQQLAGISAGRDTSATISERAPLPQGERVLNLHQAAPEQNARQLSQQVQVMVNRELQEADIRLNPSELGGMRIQLKFDQGEVSMHIQAQHAQARDMLEQAMPRLRDMLSQQGIQLGQGQVGGFAGQQGSAQNGASGQGATGRENGHNPSPFEQGPGGDEPAYGGQAAGALAGDGRIDFFA